MTNVIISALIAIFFLGKSTKEVREKTARASWFRTLVFFFLTIISGIVFYKSYQVATIVNFVNIDNLRGGEDSQHNPKDTVERVTIYNKFKNAGSYNNEFLSFANQQKGAYSYDYTQNGGALVQIKFGDYLSDEIINSPYLNDEMKLLLEKELNENISNIGPIYAMNFVSTSIPSFFPFYPIVNTNPVWEKGDGCSGFCYVENSRNAHGLIYTNLVGETKYFDDIRNEMRLFNNGMIAHVVMAVRDKDSMENVYNAFINSDYASDNIFFGISMWASHALTNTINFFTAADISQYSYILGVSSDMDIKGVSVEYNLPIEMDVSVDGLTVGCNSFYFNNEFLKECGGSALFHVKLPTMANLQLIRSLILTALFTTVFSLFCTNMLYCLRKRAMKYHREHPLKISVLRRISRKRIKLFKCYIYLIVFLFLAIILVLAGMVLFDKTVIIDYYRIELKIVGITLIFLALFITTAFILFKYAITPLPKKRGKDKIKDEQKRKLKNKKE